MILNNYSRILGLFTSNYSKQVYGWQIAKELKMNQKTVSNILKKMEKENSEYTCENCGLRGDLIYSYAHIKAAKEEGVPTRSLEANLLRDFNEEIKLVGKNGNECLRYLE